MGLHVSSSRIILPRKYSVCAVNSIISLSCISSLLCKKKEWEPSCGFPKKDFFFFLGEWKVAEKNNKTRICRQWQAISQIMFVYGVVQGQWVAFIHTCSKRGLIDVSYFKIQQCDFTKYMTDKQPWCEYLTFFLGFQNQFPVEGKSIPCLTVKQLQDLDISLLF